MKKMTIKKFKSKLMSVRCSAKRLLGMIFAALFMLQNTTTAYAAVGGGGISGSQIAKGTEKLIQDATTWLMILAPVAAGLLIIYFCIRRSAADEMDQKKWNNRIIVAVVSCVGAVLGSATLNIIIGYYQ